jgi:hypothetical protein
LLNRFTDGVDATRDIIAMSGNEPFIYDCMPPVAATPVVTTQGLAGPDSRSSSSSP